MYCNKLEALYIYIFFRYSWNQFGSLSQSFFMAFHLTPTQEASHDFIHPQLTNCINSIATKFAALLANNVELIFMGELASTVYLHSDRK